MTGNRPVFCRCRSFTDPYDETYPYYLRQQLNKDKCGNGIVLEAINLVIPSLRSKEILTMFLAEGVQLNPEVVTFYEGINDRGAARKDSLRAKTRKKPLLCGLLHWVRTHFITAALRHKYIDSEIRRFPVEELNARLDSCSEHFLANLNQLNEESKKRGIVFILANQQAKSGILPKDEIKGVTYNEEVPLIKKVLLKMAT